MDSAYAQQLLGELIGLARATDGNEHLISPGSTAVITACLAASREILSASALEDLLRQVEAEKRRMVPECFRCTAPCGRNNAYDLCLLQKEEPRVRELKLQILAGIQALAVQECTEAGKLFYQSLIAIGIEEISAEVLESLLRQIQTLQK